MQCSNCSHTWFQLPAKDEAKPARGKKSRADATAPEEAAGDAGDAAAEPAEADQLQLDDPEPLAVPDETDQQRQMLDDSVINILREEAEREARARRVEAETLESQPDLALPMPSPADAESDVDGTPASEYADFSAELAEEAAASDAEAETAISGDRMKMLPDIEQINSTLRAVTPNDDVGGYAAFAYLQAQRRLGFRRGFVSVLVLSLSALVIYLVAPQLMLRFPAAEPALTTYVAKVDRGRIWLDGRMRDVTVWLQGDDTKTE